MLAVNTIAKPLDINEFNSKIKRCTSDVLFSESKTLHTVSPVLYTIFDCDDKTKLELVASLGRWRSDKEERGNDYGACELTLVWFQPNFGVPNDEVALQSIQKNNWLNLEENTEEKLIAFYSKN